MTLTMADLRANTPRTILTLSAQPELLPEDALSAAVIERFLSGIDAAPPEQRDQLVGRLIDYVLGLVDGEALAECEMSGKWGDR